MNRPLHALRAVVRALSFFTVASACGGEAPASAPKPPAVLRDGFEGEALAPFWRAGDHGTGRYAPGAIVLTDELARSGRRSARITLKAGDVAQLGDSGQANERAELDSGKRAVLGEDAWCGWSFQVPKDFPIVDLRLVLAQWKQSDLEGSPTLAQRFRDGRHYVTVRDWDALGGGFREFDLPPIEPGRWHDMVWHARFSRERDGLFEVFLDGVLVARHEGTTASPDGAATFYHKVGLYRDRWEAPMTLFVDGYAIGGARDEVDPARSGE